MGISEKYSYFWTLIKGLPFGLGAIVLGINLYVKTPSDAKMLEKIKGKIEWYGEKEIYRIDLDAKSKVFIVKLGFVDYYHEKKKVREKLEKIIPGAFENEKEITIWSTGDNKIKQLSIDGNIIVPYKSHGTAIFFICFGMLVTVGAVVYTYKYPR